MKQKEINKVEIRNLQKEDYDQLANVVSEQTGFWIFPPSFPTVGK